MLRQYGGVIDIDDPRFAEEYFRVLYSKLERDIRSIQGERAELNFATTAEKFRLIEDGFSEPIVVPYGESAQRVKALRKSISRDTLRALQPYMVSVYPQDLKRLEEVHAVETVAETVRVLSPGFEHLYDRTFGLVIGESPRIDPAALIVDH